MWSRCSVYRASRDAGGTLPRTRHSYRRRRHRRASAGTSSGSSMRAYASKGRSSRASRLRISARRTAAFWTRSSRTSGSITARSARTSSTTSGAMVFEARLGRQPRDLPVARLHERSISSQRRCPQSVVTARVHSVAEPACSAQASSGATPPARRRRRSRARASRRRCGTCRAGRSGRRSRGTRRAVGSTPRCRRNAAGSTCPSADRRGAAG